MTDAKTKKTYSSQRKQTPRDTLISFDLLLNNSEKHKNCVKVFMAYSMQFVLFKRERMHNAPFLKQAYISALEHCTCTSSYSSVV